MPCSYSYTNREYIFAGIMTALFLVLLHEFGLDLLFPSGVFAFFSVISFYLGALVINRRIAESLEEMASFHEPHHDVSKSSANEHTPGAQNKRRTKRNGSAQGSDTATIYDHILRVQRIKARREREYLSQFPRSDVPWYRPSSRRVTVEVIEGAGVSKSIESDHQLDA